MIQTPMGEMYTLLEYCVAKGIHPTTGRRHVKSGQVKAYLVGDPPRYAIPPSEAGKPTRLELVTVGK